MVGTEDGALAERRTNNNELLEVPPYVRTMRQPAVHRCFLARRWWGVRREV